MDNCIVASVDATMKERADVCKVIRKLSSPTGGNAWTPVAGCCAT